MNPVASISFRSRKFWKKVRAMYVRRMTGADHVGVRAYCRRHFAEGGATFRKTFSVGAVGEAALATEVMARDLFAERPWMVPILNRGRDWIDLPDLPQSARLDRLAPSLSKEASVEIARQALSALLDIFVEGYAHRDIHGANVFWHDGQLLLIDFEMLARYPSKARPRFRDSYDLVGRGLPSPHSNGYANACYAKASSESLQMLLEVPLETAMQSLVQTLRDELRSASLTFKARAGRHACNAQRTYSSFSLPYLSVPSESVQRRTDRRLENFGIKREDIEGKAVLDLGSNIGGILFELQKFSPGCCHGVEFDLEKVHVARRVAAFNDLDNVHFHTRNIDRVEPNDIGQSFDVVFCLAVIEHVQRRQHLYELLGKLTRGTLYFEGNRTTDPREVINGLRAVGFESVEHLGVSDDDCLEKNRNRPIFTAKKTSY